jgi:hypothetical protein
MARVLVPGGTLLFMDSIQQGDGSAEELGPFEHFEAYFTERWYMSKLLVLRKEE